MVAGVVVETFTDRPAPSSFSTHGGIACKALCVVLAQADQVRRGKHHVLASSLYLGFESLEDLGKVAYPKFLLQLSTADLEC